ncbi:MAG: hypothetical protein GY757_07820 [bacterium]|nr:hypothetical protein [bacterium]
MSDILIIEAVKERLKSNFPACQGRVFTLTDDADVTAFSSFPTPSAVIVECGGPLEAQMGTTSTLNTLFLNVFVFVKDHNVQRISPQLVELRTALKKLLHFYNFATEHPDTVAAAVVTENIKGQRHGLLNNSKSASTGVVVKYTYKEV